MLSLTCALLDDINHDKIDTDDIVKGKQRLSTAKSLNSPAVNIVLDWMPAGYGSVFDDCYLKLSTVLRPLHPEERFIPGRITPAHTGIKGDIGRIFCETASDFWMVDVKNKQGGPLAPLLASVLMELAWAKQQLPALLTGPYRISDLRDAFSARFLRGGIVNADHIVTVDGMTIIRLWDNVSVRAKADDGVSMDPELQLLVHKTSIKYRSEWDRILKSILSAESAQAISVRLIDDELNDPVYDQEIYEQLYELRDVCIIHYFLIFVLIIESCLQVFAKNIRRRLLRLRHGDNFPVLDKDLHFDINLPPLLHWKDVDTFSGDELDDDAQELANDAQENASTDLPLGSSIKREKAEASRRAKEAIEYAKLKKKSNRKGIHPITGKRIAGSAPHILTDEEDDDDHILPPEAFNPRPIPSSSTIADRKTSAPPPPCNYTYSSR